MSREIKFRAWDKDVARYTTANFSNYAFTLSLTPLLRFDFDQAGGIVVDSICPGRYVYEQYTGLKDKNGVEIYEGDIVKVNGDINYYVDFEHGGFWFNNDNRKWKANRPLTHFVEINDCKVIGNIHENKELLEGKRWQ